MTLETIVAKANKIFEIGDNIVAKTTHISDLTGCTCQFGRKNKSKIIHGKVLSIYNKKPTTICSNQYVCAQFKPGCALTKVESVNIRSIPAVIDEIYGAVNNHMYLCLKSNSHQILLEIIERHVSLLM